MSDGSQLEQRLEPSMKPDSSTELAISDTKAPRPGWWIPNTLEEALGEQVDIKEIYENEQRNPVGKMEDERGNQIPKYGESGVLENFFALRNSLYVEIYGQLVETYGESDSTKHQELASKMAATSARRILSERLRTEEQYKYSRIDPLTGLPTRRAFFERVDQQVKSGTPFSILFVDLDRFKSINDDTTLGHDVGDWVLAQAAQRLTASVRQDKIVMPGGTEQQADLRETDLVARFGGEEMVVLISGEQNPDNLEIIGNRIVTAFNSKPFPTRPEGSDREITVTASVGGAISQPNEKPTDTLKRADRNVYAAKHGGRNQFVGNIPAQVKPIS
jgi:GGDEF domain-containing protein